MHMKCAQEVEFGFKDVKYYQFKKIDVCLIGMKVHLDACGVQILVKNHLRLSNCFPIISLIDPLGPCIDSYSILMGSTVANLIKPLRS